MEKFLEILAEILEEDTVSLDDVLEDFDEWDSLSALSVVAAIDSDYSVFISSEDLAAVKTAGQLWQLVKSKQAGQAT